jgi:lipoprotein NlpI
LKYKLGDYSLAVFDFERCISLNPDFAPAHKFMGLSKCKLNKKEECCLSLSKAGELGAKDAYELISEYCQ